MHTNITETSIQDGNVTALAIALDAAMGASAANRAAYLATWGVEWVSLVANACGQLVSHAATTEMGTVR